MTETTYNETMDQVRRERETEQRVRAMDVHQIVDEIHSLEDQTEILGEALNKVEGILGLLGSAVAQACDSDDKIIMDNVRAAHEQTRALYRRLRDPGHATD